MADERSPSIRRVLAGYLRLRDPYMMVLDALGLLAMSYVLSYTNQWLERGWRLGEVGSRENYGAWWFGWALGGFIQSMLFYAAAAVVLVAVARVIAAGRPEPREGPL